MTTPSVPTATQIWRIFRVPLQIFCIGASVILLIEIWRMLGLPDFGAAIAKWLAAAPEPSTPGLNPSATLAALLVMAGAFTVVAMLWWLIGRYFRLLEDGKVAADPAALRDLPLGLPEGTVRSILALIVAIVGLPIMIFSQTLHLTDPLIGYINGIIAGVFGFYFGSRTSTASTQALNQAAAAGRQAEAVTAAATAKIAGIEAERDAAVRDGQTGPLVDQLTRHLELASVLVDPIGPLLPTGLLPAGLKDAVANAEAALVALGKGTPGPDDLKRATDAATALVSGSAIDHLLKTAAPMTGGPPATLAALLAVGWKLDAAPYQRWNALVLAAPVTPALIDGGTVTQQEVTDAIAAATLPAPWAAAQQKPTFLEHLTGVILAADAADTLWSEYSKPGTTDGVFDDRTQITDGLGAIQRELLASRIARDLTDTMMKTVLATLATTADVALEVAASFNATAVLNAAETAGKASAAETASDTVQAAFDALVTLVAVARRAKVDLPTILSEVRP
jgi:hypothetical protein